MSETAAAIWLFALVRQHVPIAERQAWAAVFAHLDPDSYRFVTGTQPDVAELDDDTREQGVDHLAIWIFGNPPIINDQPPKVRKLANDWYSRLGGEELWMPHAVH